jgi:DNA-binding response OmpR family regulator
MTRVLIVDDDPKLSRLLHRGLAGNGITSEVAGTGAEALAILESAGRGAFDIVLLDVMLPGASGWEILERMRATLDDTPAIFVTARDAVEERVKGLELGADDYIIKPFELAELLARIEAVLRRRALVPQVQYGPLTMNYISRTVTLAGEPCGLTSKEFDLFVALASRAGEVLHRTELLNTVWNIDFDPESNIVDVYIARVRSRLRPYGAAMIETVRGQGYRFNVPAELDDPRHS